MRGNMRTPISIAAVALSEALFSGCEFKFDVSIDSKSQDSQRVAEAGAPVVSPDDLVRIPAIFDEKEVILLVSPTFVGEKVENGVQVVLLPPTNPEIPVITSGTIPTTSTVFQYTIPLNSGAKLEATAKEKLPDNAAGLRGVLHVSAGSNGERVLKFEIHGTAEAPAEKPTPKTRRF